MKHKFTSISNKIIITTMTLVLIMVVSIMSSTIVASKVHNDVLMTERATASVRVLKESLQTERIRLETIGTNVIHYDLQHENIKDIWTQNKPTETEYLAVYNAGNVLYASDNYIEIGYANGIVSDGTRIVLQSVLEQADITVVVGMDLADTSFLDNVKTETGAEVTLFLNDVRYNTTVIDQSGLRAIGTLMGEQVATAVLDNADVYTAQTDIMEQRHYVCYEPMYMEDGSLIGAYFAGYSAEESDKSFNSVILNAIIIAVIAIAVMTVIMLYIVKKNITEPIKRVTQLAQDMSNSQLHTQIDLQKFNNDELGVFARDLVKTQTQISGYVDDITNVLQAMSSGDFTVQAQKEYNGDFEALHVAFGQIEKILKQLLTDINVATAEVQAGATQMSESSQLLAEGTVTQASAVEELNTTVGLFVEQIHNNAANANKANELAIVSQNKLQAQQETVQELVTAMDEIKTKAQEISGIIKAIDDIAFQTNILALNAAVEAARAGEVGRGFAVVADEVRNLAGKSAASVKSTSELIMTTLNAVENGARAVESTTKTMQDVADISNEINTIITSITEETQQQSETVNQINTGVNQIADVIQTNSATAEESAASSEELCSQSGILNELIGRLKI